MASIDANLCSLSAEVRSFLSRTIEWPVMNVAADQDSTSNDSVQPVAVGHSHDPKYFQSYIPDVMQELFAF
ncbi:hypothetical protein ACMFLR_18085 [Delftia tsuruhatensis]|jgi:hypothetical protein|uniref:hypothetical protein n=1 Tax=Delftia tsuruhatensis TaxID=180282 RepID=UPI000DB21BE2|nr:hypothetical protein [Delftia tsuruhatensis]MDH0421874.1 hypothetical protein [Delftia tsuruhatensis]PZP64860.1 MAG: hypothetical protein DI604_25980 [Delftia acidovorans]